MSTKHEKACNQCEYKGETNKDLKLHFETVHEGIRYFCVQCRFKTNVVFHHKGFWYSYDQCTFEVGTKQGLICHVKTVHEGVQYSCDRCDFKARRKHILKVHEEAFTKKYDIIVISVTIKQQTNIS